MGIIARRVIDYLKTNGHDVSLRKLRHEERGRDYRYSLWDHHSNTKLLTHEDVFLQKVHYFHQNPVRAGLVEKPEDYRWSSARCWQHKPLQDEPITVDIDQISWFRK